MQTQNSQNIPSYTLQQWYHLLPNSTSPSIFVPLTAQQIRSIICAYDVVYQTYFRELNYKKKANQNQLESSFVLSKQNWIFREEVAKVLKQSQLYEIMLSLLAKIKAQILEGKKYFTKLSLRSPKDSLALRKYKERLSRQYSEDQLLKMGNELDRLALIVRTAQQILQVLISSQRIKDDLKRWQKQKNYEVNIIIREWQTIPSCLEFRVFMKNREITAISSYYKSQIHEWLFKYKKQISDKILTFFKNELQNQIPYQDAVFDIGFQLPYRQLYLAKDIEQKIKTKQYSPTLIQTNPFSKASGAALFNWQTDKHVLNYGPLEVRFSGENQYK